jgi:lysophospholipase L1-like esterase
MKDRGRYNKGVALARAALERRQAATTRSAAAAFKGDLIAEGDSWFDYPFFDVLEMLEDDGWKIESAAHKGDNLEDMAHDETQIDRLARAFDKFRQHGVTPRAILLSGGGNDIAGDEFPVLLNHANSGLPALNDEVVTGLIDTRLRHALASLLGTLATFSRNFFGETKPILVHGYGYPVPDGRGYLGGAWILPGPWLEPGFRRKGHFGRTPAQQAQALQANAAQLRKLIDRYNAMMEDVASSLPKVHYVNLRDILTGDPTQAYKKDWNDELHPTRSGFRRVADEFEKVLATV